jgi:hypothetical protein
MADNAAEPRGVWVVQSASGGIPEEPILFDNVVAAERCFVEIAVEAGLPFTDDCSASWIGNDDDEVRIWGPVWVASVSPPAQKKEWVREGKKNRLNLEVRPFNDRECVEVERILGILHAPKVEPPVAGG